MRFPSGDQLGKPVLAGPCVRSRDSEPSARTIMTRAGLARGTKKEPTPNTIHFASGDHSAENAMLPSSWKMRLLLAPSESITASAVSIPGRSLRSLSTSDFPSREIARAQRPQGPARNGNGARGDGQIGRAHV